MLGSGREDADLGGASESGLGGSPEDGQLASKGSALGISGQGRGLEGGDFLGAGWRGGGAVGGLAGWSLAEFCG